MSTPETTPTRDDILARARDMIPALRERADRAEQARRIPEETDQAFRDAGFYKIMQPSAYMRRFLSSRFNHRRIMVFSL
ncbi:MAG: hypothetical protein O3C49_09420, partial [Proteobacteria bacterium]|nr:hypothetical protein [Pseudomonadota bacterium]MDA1326065.1 hypothetical protein [Pseudomonadota bacterium]